MEFEEARTLLMNFSKSIDGPYQPVVDSDLQTAINVVLDLATKYYKSPDGIIDRAIANLKAQL